MSTPIATIEIFEKHDFTSFKGIALKQTTKIGRENKVIMHSVEGVDPVMSIDFIQKNVLFSEKGVKNIYPLSHLKEGGIICIDGRRFLITNLERKNGASFCVCGDQIKK